MFLELALMHIICVSELHVSSDPMSAGTAQYQASITWQGPKNEFWLAISLRCIQHAILKTGDV